MYLDVCNRWALRETTVHYTQKTETVTDVPNGRMSARSSYICNHPTVYCSKTKRCFSNPLVSTQIHSTSFCPSFHTLRQWSSAYILGTHCPACLRCFPALTQLAQMNGSLTGLWITWEQAVEERHFIWIRCVGAAKSIQEDQSWGTLHYEPPVFGEHTRNTTRICISVYITYMSDVLAKRLNTPQPNRLNTGLKQCENHPFLFLIYLLTWCPIVFWGCTVSLEKGN